MGTKICVLGLHQSGLSIGLALQPYNEKISCVGYDSDRKQIERGVKLGAFLRVESDLAKALKEAEMVILTLPADKVEETLKSARGCLKEGAQVISISSLHQGTAEILQTCLPQGVHFVSVTPILNPQYLDEPAEKADEAHADLFHHGALLIGVTEKTSPEIIQSSADLAELLGAHAYFTEPQEADAFFADVEILPELVSAALVNAVSDSAGWKDSRRLAGKSFYRTTATLNPAEDVKVAADSLLQSKNEILHSLDRMSEALSQFRDAIEQKDADGLNQLLVNARENRKDWLDYRITLDWNTADGKPADTKRNVPGHLFWTQKKK